MRSTNVLGCKAKRKISVMYNAVQVAGAVVATRLHVYYLNG